MWCLGVAYSADKVQDAATADMVNFVYAANTQFVGEWSTKLMQILAITSVFAVLLSFHNALCRYLFALARSGFLPQQLSSVHSRFRSPYKASITRSVITLVILGLFIMGKTDPMGQLYRYNVALGTLAILVLQTFGAIAVIGFFLKREDRSLWEGVIAPAIGGAGLILVVILAVANFGDFSGAKEGLAQYLPLLVIVAAVVGTLNVPSKQSANSTHSVVSE
jgi:amino acid transporter